MEDNKNYGQVENTDTIEITLEDLEDVPVNNVSTPQKIYGKAQKVDTIEITWDDLNEPDSQPKNVYGSVPNYSNVAGYEKKGKKIESQNIFYPALIGLCGGFLAFLINEPFNNEGSTSANALASMGLFLGIIGALIAAALSCVEDFKSFVFEKAIRHFSSGLFAGFVTGFIGGIIAQIIFGIMTLSGNGFVLWIARTIGWAIAGTFVGVSQSIVDFKFNKGRLKNGLLGGVIGGAIGGMLFDPIATLFSFSGGTGAHSGWISRCIGICVTGGAIGAAISLISETLKEAWLYIVEGPLKGKQFILYEQVTTFGSSPKCSITVVKDQKIMPNHFSIENHGTYYTLIGNAPTLLNGVSITSKNLRDGDIIVAGNTSFQYEENSLENKIK